MFDNIYNMHNSAKKKNHENLSANFASHLHISPFFLHILSADSFSLCTIPGRRSHNSSGLIFYFFKCTIHWDFCSYYGCTRKHLNLFYLPEILCPDQHLPSIFLSSADSASSAPALTICAFCLSLAFFSSTQK